MKSRILQPFRDFLESAPDAMVIVNEDGEIVLVNSQTEKLFGYSRQELLGQLVEHLLAPRSYEVHIAHRKTYFGNPRMRPMDAGLELYAIRKSGSEFPVEISLSPLRTRNGLLVTAAIRDITERKRQEKALQYQTNLLQSVLNNMKDGVMVADEQERFLVFNSAAERILRRGPTEQPSIQWSDHYKFFLPDRAKTFPVEQLPLVRAINGESCQDVEMFVGHTEDQEGKWISVSSSPLKGTDGRLSGGIAVFRDITEARRIRQDLARRVEELNEVNQELEAFSYSVSHDLRAPLRQIDGFSTILLEEASNSLTLDQRECLQQVRQGVRRMGDLIDALLNFARLGRQSLNIQHIDLCALVWEIVGELQKETQDRRLTWRVGSLSYAECDRALLRQALWNLLSNAIKFTRTREHAVIEIVEERIDGERVCLIRDNGVGFNMKYSDKLFGVFQRLHRQEEFEGTGIGLATVQRILVKHGLNVWAKSEPGSGATFFFTLDRRGERALCKAKGNEAIS